MLWLRYRGWIIAPKLSITLGAIKEHKICAIIWARILLNMRKNAVEQNILLYSLTNKSIIHKVP